MSRVQTHRARLENILGGRVRLSKKPGERTRWLEPFRALIVPGGVYGGDGAIFAAENPIFQSKNRFLAVSAPGNP